MAKIFGLELAGAKNQKTTLAVMERYAKENKTFLLDIYTGIGPAGGGEAGAHFEEHSGDHALLSVIDECLGDGGRRRGEPALFAVNVPMTFPPCVTCTKKLCPMPDKCTVPSVRWMRQHENPSLTPYTQRPVELWLRSELKGSVLPTIDDAMGGARAALTARMVFLKRHLLKRDVQLIEVWPRLTMLRLAAEFQWPMRWIKLYRDVENGVYARRSLLERWVERTSTFIYERDLEKLSRNLGAFDAWVCAWTALLYQDGKVQKPPKGFPISSGWIQYPK